VKPLAIVLFRLIYVMLISFWQCASAIDSLAAFYFNNITAGDTPPSPAALNLARHIGEFPSLFPQVCVTKSHVLYYERFYSYNILFVINTELA
jgi:hypothetical protein